jgi:hypothetical protein
MATQPQTIANAANAQFSTGPRTGEGKAKSSRNAITHGFTTGVLMIPPADRAEFDAFEKALTEDMKPEGALEMDAMREFRDAAWRLRQIRKCTCDLFDKHNEDPLTHPETAAAIGQLTRYRAAAEMSLHRALNTFRDLQTTRLGRIVHLAKSENEAIGPLASPKVFAYMMVEGFPMDRRGREAFDAHHGITEIG